MRGCPAVMGIVRLRWGVSAFRAYTARRRVLTSRRRGKQPRYSFPDASPQHHAPLNTRRQHCAIALNSTSEKCSKKCSRTPARWVGWASPRRSSPVSVRTAHAPRRSSGHGSLRTNPSASRHLSNRLSPLLRVKSTLWASSPMRIRWPGAHERWSSTSKEESGSPCASSSSASSFRTSAACVRRNPLQAPV